jgi:hypothetical protein
MPQFARQTAERCGERLLAMFRDPPLEAKFSLHVSRDGELDYARYFFLETADVQDETGAVSATAMAPVEIERGENEIVFKAHEVAFSSATDDDGVRRIYIENNSFNLNLRATHDSLYTAPVGGSPGEVVEFIIMDSVTVGSTSTSTPAVSTGTWPSGVSLTLVIHGRIQGKGGAGGKGALWPNQAVAGTDAGLALLVDDSVHITGAGEIYGGGGGGGGGGGQDIGGGKWGGSGGGGGGAGTEGGAGGLKGGGSDGAAGTADAGGAGGAGVAGGGSGGDGGDPGTAGDAGTNATTSGAAGGAAGNAIDGVSLATFDSPNSLDIQGGQVN